MVSCCFPIVCRCFNVICRYCNVVRRCYNVICCCFLILCRYSNVIGRYSNVACRCCEILCCLSYVICRSQFIYIRACLPFILITSPYQEKPATWLTCKPKLSKTSTEIPPHLSSAVGTCEYGFLSYHLFPQFPTIPSSIVTIFPTRWTEHYITVKKKGILINVATSSELFFRIWSFS